jgi:hypothetical protein
MVADAKALEAMVLAKPTTVEALSALPGFGASRVERYGEPLLVCVRAHMEALAATGVAPCTAAAAASSASAPAAAPACDCTATSSAATGSTAGGSSACSMCTIRYSHYSDRFELASGGRLDFRAVDRAYRLSCVLRGIPPQPTARRASPSRTHCLLFLGTSSRAPSACASKRATARSSHPKVANSSWSRRTVRVAPRAALWV